MKEGIAYLCGEYPRATDTFIQREVAALREAGVRVRTISIRRPAASERPRDDQAKESAATLYILPTNPWRLALAHGRALARSPIRYLNAFALAVSCRAPGLRNLLYQFFYFAEAGVVADTMRRENLSHLHNHAPDASGYVTMIAAAMSGYTYSLTLHGHGVFSEPSRWRLKEKLNRALFAICVSWHARSQAMLWSDPAIWPRLHVVHCGIDPSNGSPRLHKGQGSRLLYVGRLDHVKGLPLLIDAIIEARQLRPEVHLDIVGDGPERTMLETLVERCGLSEQVQFHGYLTQTEIASLLQQADAFVMSSFVEGIPVVLMEAMASGVPVIAPRITGIPELVTDRKTGLLFTPGDPSTLAQTIVFLLGDPELRTAISANAHAKVHNEFNLCGESQRLVHVMRSRLDGTSVEIRPECSEAIHHN